MVIDHDESYDIDDNPAQVVLAAGYGSSKDISVYSRFPIQFFF